MTEPKNESPPDTEPAPPALEAEPTKTLFGVPLEAFVRGSRTSTSANDARVAKLEFESEARRDAADRDRLQARLPKDHPMGGGQMFTNQLTDTPEVEQSYVELTYLTPRGDPWFEFGEAVKCLADIILIDDKTMELAIIMVCPSCKARGIPLDQCQLRIRQTNKRWELDMGKAGALIMWCEGNALDGTKIYKPYRSAGVITETEKFACDCGWTARIHNNTVRPE